MRFFKFNKDYNFNWKYVIGETALIFMGISLAIWFNNWNTSNRSNKDKDIAIVKITEEITNNLVEIQIAQDSNQQTAEAFAEFKKLFDGNSPNVIATPSELNGLQKKYPAFFVSIDSTLLEPGTYRYSGETRIQLEIPPLTQIAWETSRTMAITNEFSYECLYELESLYNLQRRVQNEIDKASDALQKRALTDLMNILRVTDQLNRQLIDDYNEMLNKIKFCR